MNVDELRSALHEPAPVPLHVDLDRVVARGRRRRAVRRGAVPLAVVATAVAVSVPTAYLGADDLPRGSAGSPLAPATDRATPTPGDRPAPSADRPAPSAGWPTATAQADPRPIWGTVTGTGYRAPGAAGERAVWFVRMRNAQLPGVDFAVVVGHLAGGRPVPDASANAVDPSPRSPGFHALWSSDQMALGGGWLLVGYYSGPVARATVDVDGRTVPLKVSPWSVDRSISAVWLDASSGLDAPAQDSFTRFRAYDRADRPLPVGDPAVGVG